MTPDPSPALSNIMQLASHLRYLQQQMVETNAPLVQQLIRDRVQDEQEIERTLDRLLDCAGTPEGLVLFKSLCRHYYGINPAATASYVDSYREMWDGDVDQRQQAIKANQRGLGYGG